MGKLKLSALLLGAALYMSLGATSLLATSSDSSDCCKDAKCTKTEKTCDKKAKVCKEDCKKACCIEKKSSGKCGEKKSTSSMKCGAGKCGGN